MNRIRSIDITRGLVMVIMALDHVREFWHVSSMTTNPTDLQTTTTVLFFTRWITHLCAPAFVFLAGSSAYLSFMKDRNTGRSSGYLLSRGLWLIILEFTLINFALWFDIRFRLLILEVIAAIGFGFVVLSLLLKLKPVYIGIAGLLIIAGHNLLQAAGIPEGRPAAMLFSVLFRPNMITFSESFSFFTAYPVIPWLGIMMTGFGCGRLFELHAEKRKKVFLITGIVMVFIFSVLRFLNIYGDPAPWAKQETGWFTFLSFINLTKYPPSMMFSVLFIGLTFIALYISEHTVKKTTGYLEVFGRVPFFYFIVHLYLIHSLMFLMLFIQGYAPADLRFGPFMNGRPGTAGGTGLGVVYLVWAGVVTTLYPLCRWYASIKAARKERWYLRYL